jgi:F420-dependent oxidoreductase-like protein
MRFGYWINTSYSWADTLTTAQTAERLGWDCLWYSDHFMPNAPEPADGPVNEALTVLSALASTTTRIKLGTIVLGNTYRHPAVLAKMAASIDRISGGRFILGLGAGWQENEHTAYGIELGTVKSRMDRFDESCEALNLLFSQERTTFNGDHVKLTNAPLDPKPVQSPLPLLLGGGGEKRTLKIVAKHAHQWNVWATPELFAQKLAVLNRHCADIGRDPDTIQKTVAALLFLTEDQAVADKLRSRDLGRPTIIGNAREVADQVRAYAALGVDELIIPGFTFPNPEAAEPTLHAVMEMVKPLL